VKADPEHDGFVAGLVAICLDHGLLEIYRRGERVHRTRELDQAPIALEPDHSTASARGGRGEPLVQMFQKPRNRAAFVPPHQPRRSNRVCKEDRRQPALLSGHGNFHVSAQDRRVPGTARQLSPVGA
jgi:hypothetical protein